MNVRQLQYFLAVAHELNFTRAAERVGIAQPPLSQQIIALEEELGAPLFTRDKRRVQLTPAGTILIEHAQRVVNAMAAAMDAVRSAGRGAQSRIMVGAIYSAVYAFLPDMLRIFATTSPETEVRLQEMTVMQQIRALKDGVIEVGIMRGPVHERNIRFETLFREPLVVAVPTESTYAGSPPVSIQEMAEWPVIAVGRGANRGYSDRVLDVFELRDIRPRIAHEVSDMHTSLCLVAAGLGVSIVPSIMQKVGTRGVAYRQLADPTPGVSLVFAWRDAEVSPLLKSFFAAARQAAVAFRAANAALHLEAPPR